MGYSPRTYGGPESGLQWKETIDGKTYEYYTVIKDPGNGGPLGLSGNLAGDVLVYRKNTTLGLDLGQSDDILVGEIAATGSNKGKLINESPILLPHLTKELEHFSKPENLKRVKQQAKITSKKGMLATKDVNGVDIKPVADSTEDASKKTDDLLDYGTTKKENREKEEEKEEESEPTAAKKPSIATDHELSDKGIEQSNMYYPIDVGSTNMDVMKIQMLKYEPRKLGVSENPSSKAGGDPIQTVGLGNRPEQSNRRIGGTVFLAIPGNIQDSNGVTYTDGEMDPFKALGMGVFKGLTDLEGKKQGDLATALANELGDKGADAGAFITNALGSKVMGLNPNQVFARTQGAILNNNLELLFQSPQLRRFQFVFLFSPRSTKEAITVKRIIRYFKQGMATKQSGKNFFLKSPNTFQLNYLHRGESGGDHPGLNRFKECALERIDVNYTPNTNYATYHDGTPVAYQVTMQFKELVPIFNEDYSELDQSSIGGGFATFREDPAENAALQNSILGSSGIGY